MIKVDVGRPVIQDASVIAQQFAQQIGGIVQEDVVRVDGETGIRVTSTKAEPALKNPAEVVIVIRDGRAILIMGASKEVGAVSEPIESIIRSWQWDK
jgi:hypothetical protein